MIAPILTLARREFVRFVRQPHRVAGSLGQPVLFWLFLGSGFTPSFQGPGLSDMTYLEYFYPGVLMMMMLFTSVFSVITVIEDRDQGFLQGVVVAPVPRLAIVLGKVLGSAGIALFQSFLLLLAAPFLGLPLTVSGSALVIGSMILCSLGFTTLGFAFGWGMRSTSGFHAFMMIFLMPLWILSGAMFPLNDLPGWLDLITTLNPVTHAMTLLRAGFYAPAAEALAQPGVLGALGITAAWVLAGLIASARRVKAREEGAPLG